jgi:hypothetical protein
MVAPRIAEVVVADHLGTGLACGGERACAIVDDEPDVAFAVAGLRTAFGQRQELIAHA